MLLANLFGGPGCGKSTGASYIFSKLKDRKIKTEYVPEFAKDLSYEYNYNALSNQAYVFGNQLQRIWRCKDSCDVIIIDSPIILSIIYNRHPEVFKESFNQMVLDIFNTFNNFNCLLSREKQYIKYGRNESEEEAKSLDGLIKNLLIGNNIKYSEYPGTITGYDMIYDDIMYKLEKK